MEQVGDASIDRGIDERIDGDLDKAFQISLPLTLLILLVAFGAIVAAGVPVLLAVPADRQVHTLQVASPSDFDSPQALAALERCEGRCCPPPSARPTAWGTQSADRSRAESTTRTT